MASVSLSLTAAQTEDLNPENITVGSSVPGAGDIEIRVNMANVTSLQQVGDALKKFNWFVEDQKYGPSTFLVL